METYFFRSLKKQHIVYLIKHQLRLMLDDIDSVLYGTGNKQYKRNAGRDHARALAAIKKLATSFEVEIPSQFSMCRKKILMLGYNWLGETKEDGSPVFDIGNV